MPIDITDVTRRVQYAGSGTGPYNFTFQILDDDDVAVYQDDTLLVKTTDYTVTINVDGTGSITTVSSILGSDNITIIGARPYARLTDFSTGGDFFASDVNDELDSMMILIQQLREETDRALSISSTTTYTGSLTFPAPGAGEYLRWNVGGTALETVSASPDEGTFTQSGTGAVARSWTSKVGEVVSFKDFGAAADGVADDSSAVQAAVNTGKPIRLNHGEIYKVTQQIEVTENLWIEGHGAKVLFTSSSAFFLYNAAADAIDHFVIDGLTIETNVAPRSTTTTDVLRIYGASFIRIENCNLIGGNIRMLAASEGGIIRNNRISGTNTAGDVTLLYGVYCGDGKKYLVEGNVIDTFTTDGVKCGDPTTTVPTPGHYRIIGNDISDCAQNGIDVYDAGRDSLIANNIIHGTCSSGLEIKSEPLAGGNADNSNRVALTGNVVKNTGALGVLLAGSSYSLTGNVIVGAFSDSAVRVGSAGDNTETAYMRDIIIAGNVMENTDSGNGLRIRQNKNNVSVTANSIVGAGTRTGTGISIADTEGGRVSVVANTFRNLNYGVNFQTYAAAALNFSGNFLENINSVAQLASSLATAWVRIAGNIATNINTAPIAAGSPGALASIIKENSWQQAGPMVLRASVSNVGSGEDDLNSYSLPASTLQRNSQALRIIAWGTTANNANAKTVRLYFGSAAIQATAMTINQSSQWRCESIVMRTGASTQSYTSQMIQGGVTTINDVEAGNATQTDTAAITIKVTGDATSDADITNLGLIVEPVNY